MCTYVRTYFHCLNSFMPIKRNILKKHKPCTQSITPSINPLPPILILMGLWEHHNTYVVSMGGKGLNWVDVADFAVKKLKRAMHYIRSSAYLNRHSFKCSVLHRRYVTASFWPHTQCFANSLPTPTVPTTHTKRYKVAYQLYLTDTLNEFQN